MGQGADQNAWIDFASRDPELQEIIKLERAPQGKLDQSIGWRWFSRLHELRREFEELKAMEEAL